MAIKYFQHKARIVCSECNGGWMSSLEQQAKSLISKLIRLDKIVLDKNNQDVLAFWSQKTVLMLDQSIPGGLKITQDLYDDIYKNKSCSQKVMVNLGWRMHFGVNKDDPIASFEIKQIPSLDVLKPLSTFVEEEKERGGFAWKAIFALGPIVFELVGHNMKITLNCSSNTQVFKTIRPYNNDILWPLEWPIEAEGGLNAIKSRS